MLARVRTSTITGIDAVTVDVEVDVRTKGAPRFVIIGLADSAIRESKDRVLVALKHVGLWAPPQVLVNLAPAELRKEGTAFDLAIALGILAATGQISPGSLVGRSFHGELSFDGRLKGVRGALALAIQGGRDDASEIFVPEENAREAALIDGVPVRGISSLTELVGYLRGEGGLAARTTPVVPIGAGPPSRVLDDVTGQSLAKRAMTIAAAGGHNLLFVGPPGCGKTMLAERFPSVLPPLTRDEMMEVVKIHSIAQLPIERLLRGEAPFRAPHHGVSDAGLIGGGAIPRPGEISLAHRGVLFLDEFPEYRRGAIEALRGPLESGRVHVSRAKATFVFPARFQLLAAMNPCPCGRLGMKDQTCMCSLTAIQGYLRKLSQPILDRIDLHVELKAVPLEQMLYRRSGVEKGPDPRSMVIEARQVQRTRGADLNAYLSGEEVAKIAPLDKSACSLLERGCSLLGVSARGYVRILRVARTIADLEAAQQISEEHIAEALQFRCLDRMEKLFGSERSAHVGA